MNAHEQYLYGCDEVDLEELMNDWTSPGINVEEVIRVVENDRGEIIGYIDVWDNSQPHVVKYIWGVLHPDAWDADLYREMLVWAEECSRERINLAPEGTKVVMRQGTSNKDIDRKTALEAFGFQLARHFYRMEIDLDQPPQRPVIPEGIRIAPINMDTDLEAAVITTDEAFKDHWGYYEQPFEELMKQWKHFLENDQEFDPSLWFLAKDGEEIAGACRCSTRKVEDPKLGWISQLSVRKPWRSKGLGTALLLTGFHEFMQRGMTRVGLGVDAASLTNATRLYEKAGMKICRQYDSYVKELRPGKDLTTEKYQVE
jgi:ribosomal protein S18 acetylase RimI-like enzyme